MHGTTARERLARLLDDAEAPGSFSAQILAPAHSCGLRSTGVGPVSLPVRAPQAKKLIAVARPAKFGRGEQTLTDTSVRDTWEITPDRHAGRPRLEARSAPRWSTSGTSWGSRRRHGCGPSCTRCWCTARDSSSCRTRTRRRTTQWWARWWCRCLRRTRAGNWSSSTAARASRTARRRRSCLSSRSTPTAVTRSSP